MSNNLNDVQDNLKSSDPNIERNKQSLEKKIYIFFPPLKTVKQMVGVKSPKVKFFAAVNNTQRKYILQAVNQFNLITPYRIEIIQKLKKHNKVNTIAFLCSHKLPRKESWHLYYYQSKKRLSPKGSQSEKKQIFAAIFFNQSNSPEQNNTETLREFAYLFGMNEEKKDTYSQKYNVLSNNKHENYESNTDVDFLQLYDIFFLHSFYGQNMKTASGNTYYECTNAELSERKCLWDADGVDHINLMASKEKCLLDMRDGQFSSIGSDSGDLESNDNFSIAYTAKIENITGSEKGDIIITNEQDNIINTGKADDIVYLSDRHIELKYSDTQNGQFEQTIKNNGWGHDIYYNSGGNDQIILDVQYTSDLSFQRTGESLIIKYETIDHLSDKKHLSSLLITNYNPQNTVIWVCHYSEVKKEFFEEDNKERLKFGKNQSDFSISGLSYSYSQNEMLINRMGDYNKQCKDVSWSNRDMSKLQWTALSIQ